MMISDYKSISVMKCLKSAIIEVKKYHGNVSIYIYLSIYYLPSLSVTIGLYTSGFHCEGVQASMMKVRGLSLGGSRKRNRSKDDDDDREK